MDAAISPCNSGVLDYQQMVESNHNLIYSFLQKHNLGEDFYGDAAIGLCNAAMSFDSSRGASFSTFAYSCMLNECRKTLRIENKSSGYVMVSLDAPISSDDDDLTLDLPSDDESFQTTVETTSGFEWFIENMSCRDLQILIYRFRGDLFFEIADKLNVSRQCISNRIKKLRKMYESGSRPRKRMSTFEKENQEELKETALSLFKENCLVASCS